MRRKPRSGRPSSPIDSKQAALEKQQADLRQKMQKLERMIEEAPKLAEIEERRRRDELLARSREGARRLESRTSLVDKRFDLHTGYVSSGRRSLKAERREARLKFFGLCVLLAALLIFLFSLNPF